MKRINISFDEEQLDRLDALTIHTGMDRSRTLRNILDAYFLVVEPLIPRLSGDKAAPISKTQTLPEDIGLEKPHRKRHFDADGIEILSPEEEAEYKARREAEWERDKVWQEKYREKYGHYYDIFDFGHPLPDHTVDYYPPKKDEEDTIL